MPAICVHMKWVVISAAHCSLDPRVCNLFLEPPIKKRLPLVTQTSTQSNQPKWWWGGHMLISISSLRMLWQRTLCLSGFVILLTSCARFVSVVVNVHIVQTIVRFSQSEFIYLLFTKKKKHVWIIMSSWSPWAGWHKFIRGQTSCPRRQPRTHTHTAMSQWTQRRAPNLNDNQTEIPAPLKDNTR